MTSKNLITGLALLFVVGAGAYFIVKNQTTNPLTLKESVASWNLPPVKDPGTSTTTMAHNVELLQSEIGKGDYADTDLYTDMGNGYVFLGDGKDAYDAYVKAIQASSTNAVAYENAALLLNRVYATSTARMAFAKAVTLAPQTPFFQLAYVEFMTLVFPKDAETPTAFANAEKPLEGNKHLETNKAYWLAKIGTSTSAQ
jgi:hypothetical protein